MRKKIFTFYMDADNHQAVKDYIKTTEDNTSRWISKLVVTELNRLRKEGIIKPEKKGKK